MSTDALLLLLDWCSADLCGEGRHKFGLDRQTMAGIKKIVSDWGWLFRKQWETAAVTRSDPSSPPGRTT